MLRVLMGDYPNHRSLIVQMERGFTVEIHGPARIEIAVAVLNNYPMRLHADDTGPDVLVDAGSDEERLFRALDRLQLLKSPVRRNEDFYKLLENPTLERLEAFLAVKKVLGEE